MKNNHFGRVFLVAAAFSGLSACTWVKPIDGAEQVSLVKPKIVQACKEIGTATAQVKDRIGFVNRRDAKVTDELIMLAKNEAARMGGDAIVALKQPEDGRQKFTVYKCAN